MVVRHFHRLCGYYFLYFVNCDCRVKSSFVLFWQIKNVNYNSEVYLRKVNISTNIYFVCHSRYMADGFASEYQIGMASLVTAVFHFFSLWQIPAIIISTTPKPFCFHWWTGQDGHLLNCLKQEDIVLTEHIPYFLVHRMGPHSVEDMTFKFSTPDNPVAIYTATSAVLTAHRVGTATAAPSPKHSWQELTRSLQTK